VSQNKKRKKRLSLKAKVVILIALCFVLVGLIGVLLVQTKLGLIRHVDPNRQAFLSQSQQVFEQDANASSNTMDAKDVDFHNADIDVMSDKDISNILLIGQDARNGEKGQRSDSMIICSINKKTKKITMVSLMRDMYVPIPGYDSNRINSAYMLGGMKLLDKVIKTDFGVKIDGNLEVNFDGFLQAMTAVGDLDIELNEEEATYLNTYPGLGSNDDTAKEAWDLHTGMNSLTSSQALAYTRIRYIGNSDWERTDRQRKVLTAAFNKVRAMSLGEIFKLADKVLPCFTTDMTDSQILGYVYTVATSGIELKGKSYRIPVDGTYEGQTINGMSVLVPDLGQENAYLQHYLYGKSLKKALAEYYKKNPDAKKSTTSDYDVDVSQNSFDPSTLGNDYTVTDSTGGGTDYSGYTAGDTSGTGETDYSGYTGGDTSGTGGTDYSGNTGGDYSGTGEMDYSGYTGGDYSGTGSTDYSGGYSGADYSGYNP
jgi:LCP family protein required for cell wall assembly